MGWMNCQKLFSIISFVLQLGLDSKTRFLSRLFSFVLQIIFDITICDFKIVRQYNCNVLRYIPEKKKGEAFASPSILKTSGRSLRNLREIEHREDERDDPTHHLPMLAIRIRNMCESNEPL
jgi:hypothetical protein